MPYPITPTLSEGAPSGLASLLLSAVQRAELAERGLAIRHSGSNIAERIATGSFYTPADVVGRFWREYWDFHGVRSAEDMRAHLAAFTFVEPSVGAGMFVLSLFSEVAKFGCGAGDIAKVRIQATDINSAALAFLAGELDRIADSLGIQFEHVRLIHSDFLTAPMPAEGSISFIGNPPYIRNESGARWKNLYADFVERMLEVDDRDRSIALIIPISIAFSRDYRGLRRTISRNKGVRLDNFDNMPDYLFKAGKPGSENTNRANSQRCSIMFVRNHGDARAEATELQRWSALEREAFLSRPPVYRSYVDYGLDDQFPRPSNDWIIRYLASEEDTVTLGDLVGKRGEFGLSIGAVGRNYIGIREVTYGTSTHNFRFGSEQQMLCALQILASEVFYEYWRSVGDGFHITKSDILSFPVRRSLLSGCLSGLSTAKKAWVDREQFAKRKLNSGVEVRSYDFSGVFSHLSAFLFSSAVEDHRAREIVSRFAPTQEFLPGLLVCDAEA